MAKTFGNYSLAKGVKETVEKIATDKVNQLRPPSKTAIVDQINTEEKYCMVTFVGESLSVKVPYNNVAPSYVGQYVRVGGPANDRRIEEVLGVTETEDMLAQYERRLQHLEQIAYANARPTADFDAGVSVPKVPMNTIIVAKNIEVNSLGEFVISIPGVYEYYARVQTAAYRDALWDMYVACMPISTGVQFDVDHVAMSYLVGSAEYVHADHSSAKGYYHFDAGDKIYVNMGCSGTATCRAYGSRLSMKLIDPDVPE